MWGAGIRFLSSSYQQGYIGYMYCFPRCFMYQTSLSSGRFSFYQGENEWLQDHCMQVGDAYLIVYSITDRASFEKASELRIQLRRARQTEDIPIILVGNKSDLVRCREVSVSGKGSGASVIQTVSGSPGFLQIGALFFLHEAGTRDSLKCSLEFCV